MGKRTRDGKKERLEQIETHRVWAARQARIAACLINYTRGCLFYGPQPEADGEPGSFWYHKITQGVLVPPACDEAVVIPAGYQSIQASRSKTGHVLLYMFEPSPAEGSEIRAWSIDLDAGFEIVLPGGALAELVEMSNHTWVVVEAKVEEPAGETVAAEQGPAGEGAT